MLSNFLSRFKLYFDFIVLEKCNGIIVYEKFRSEIESLFICVFFNYGRICMNYLVLLIFYYKIVINIFEICSFVLDI